jgi:hypothetical protein
LGKPEKREKFGPVWAKNEKNRGFLLLSGDNRENRHATQVAVFQRDAEIE